MIADAVALLAAVRQRKVLLARDLTAKTNRHNNKEKEAAGQGGGEVKYCCVKLGVPGSACF